MRWCNLSGSYPDSRAESALESPPDYSLLYDASKNVLGFISPILFHLQDWVLSLLSCGAGDSGCTRCWDVFDCFSEI